MRHRENIASKELAPLVINGDQPEASPDGPPTPITDVATLFDRHATFVAKFLWKMGVPGGDIEDIVQDVFLVAHRRGGFRQVSAKPTTWLASIAFRVWGTRLRRRRNRREIADPKSIMAAASEGSGPAENLETHRSLARVRLALSALDEQARALLILVDIDGEACPDVASALGIPIGTVYSRLHAARHRFARSYEKLLRTSPKAKVSR